MSKTRGFGFSILIFTLLMASLVNLSAQRDEKSEVLILHAYHENLRWTRDINRGMNEALEQGLDSYELFVEYMDLKRNDPQKMFPYLYEIYREKYRNKQPDVILSSDNSAFDFLMLYGDELFPGVPVFFCGVNNFEPSMIEGQDNFTGILEKTDTLGTINSMVEVLPDLTHIAAISCRSPSGVLHKQELEEIEPQIEGDVKVVYIHSQTPKEMKKSISELPPTTAILFLSYYYDGLGNYRSNFEALTFVKSITDLPFFSLWDYYVEWDVVGGIVTSGIKQGRAAAEMAIAHLKGTPISDLPIVSESSRSNELLFNYDQLKKYKIPETILPPQSRIINRPDTFYTRNRGLVLSVLIIFSLLITLVMTMFVDLNRRMRLEKELKLQERILSDTINHIPHIVYWKNHDDQIMGSNNSFKGAQREKTIVLDWIVPIENEVKSSGLPVFFKEIEKNIDKTEKLNLLITVIPVEDMDSPLSLITLIQDISQQKKLEGQLKQTGKMESIGRLSGGIAHDFNNLLTGIVGSADMILQAGVSPEIEGYLNLIFETADRANELISGLLSYARKAPLYFAPLTLKDLIESTISILERTIEKTISIEFQEVDKNLAINGDKSMLQSALMNLGINAQDAMKGKKGKLIYRVSYVHSEKPMAHIEVIDEGDGIDTDVLDKIFEPFYTTKDIGRGTGLGLAGVYGCIKSHKGTISVESQREQGTIFRILLPILIT